jgi:hypothetical protein
MNEMYTPEDYFKGMINMQYSIAHMYYSYWMNYMDGFIDEYEKNVRKFNEMNIDSPKPSKRRKKR